MPTHPALSTKENAVISMLMRGITTAMIALTMGSSLKTVQKHRENILRKLEVNSMRQAVSIVLAVQQANFEK